MDLSLIGTGAGVAFSALGGVGLIVLLSGFWRRGWKRVPAAATVALLGAVAVAVVVNEVWKPFPDRLPTVALLAIGFALFAVALAVSAPFRLKLVPVRMLAALLVVLAGGSFVNRHYGAYPDIRAALQLPPKGQAELAAPSRTAVVSASGIEILADRWTPPSDMPTQGQVSRELIPGTVSGFVARGAWIYQPPAYLSTPRAELPVVVLMAGQPGSPRDWLDGGNLVAMMDSYAAVHRGLAPVVVVVDQLGSGLANPGCFDSALSNVATYLSVDVPAWIDQRLDTSHDRRRWVVGGLSSGGTCALQLATNAPEVYPNFLDISGEDAPEVAPTHSETVQKAFGGDEAKFRAVNPLDLLRTRRYPSSNGIFVAGAEDKEYGPQAQTVFETAQAAGMNVELQVLPGIHGWEVWGPGLSRNLDWIGRTTQMIP